MTDAHSPTVESLEATLHDLDVATKALIDATKALEKAAARVRKASSAGELKAITRSAGELEAASRSVDDAVGDVRRAVPRTDTVTAYLAGPYRRELIAEAERQNVHLVELDGRLIAFPTIVDVNPDGLSVKVGRKSVRSLRPSAVIANIRAVAERPRIKSEQFIETLYDAARRLDATKFTQGGVSVTDLYQVLTLHPETRRTYSQIDFAADLYALETSSVRATKRGATIHFMASTGTKGSGGSLTIIGRDARPVHYVGIRFEENQ